MIKDYLLFEALLYLLVYAFVGWIVQTCCTAIRYRRFVNGGLLNLPLNIPCGISAVILLTVLPTLDHHYILQYLLTVIVLAVVHNLSSQFVRQIARLTPREPVEKFTTADHIEHAAFLLLAGVYLLAYLIVHPVFFGLISLIPELIMKIVVIAAAALIVVDFSSVVYALKTNQKLAATQELRGETQRLADRLSDGIWNRLQKAYPGIWDAQDPGRRYVFAKGLCLDKLIWVFLVSSFLGALIEMVYCRLTGGEWINRSSLLHGTFSAVWGFGAVVLTISLQRFSKQEACKVFLAGFTIGGAYEYFCSVFTELVFGTVFWDYSQMPLNIGGRTNVVYCIFWGILAVVWIKIIYPKMERGIEMLPPLFGKLLTWVLMFIMTCNALLTCGAMVRYTRRQTEETPAAGEIAAFLDERYDDEWMEDRWPNMVVTDAARAEHTSEEASE